MKRQLPLGPVGGVAAMAMGFRIFVRAFLAFANEPWCVLSLFGRLVLYSRHRSPYVLSTDVHDVAHRFATGWLSSGVAG